MGWKSAVTSGLPEISWEEAKGWDWKGIGPRNLQTLQGEGGANKRLGQPSSLLPHSAQGYVLGLDPSPGKDGRSVGQGVGAELAP